MYLDKGVRKRGDYCVIISQCACAMYRQVNLTFLLRLTRWCDNDDDNKNNNDNA